MPNGKGEKKFSKQPIAKKKEDTRRICFLFFVSCHFYPEKFPLLPPFLFPNNVRKKIRKLKRKEAQKIKFKYERAQPGSNR